MVPSKVFEAQVICSCNKQCCQKIDVLRQQEIFKTFYNLKNWTSKTLFIRGCVIRQPIKNDHTLFNLVTSLQQKTCLLKYYFFDSSGFQKEVCKTFFMRCLKITYQRVLRATKSLNDNPSAFDRRGHRPSINKSNPRDIEFLKHFIQRFPRYKSHYARQDTQKEYLAPELNIRRMFLEYKIRCNFQQRNILSEHMFRHIFNKDFNLAFKRRKTDTCKTCCELDTKILDNNLTYEQRQMQKQLKENHRDYVKQMFGQYIEMAKSSNGTIQILTFDLQQTLPTPVLSTSEAYYKRALWTYNLCIFNEVERKGYMYVWNESIGGRGADEIASCLVRYLKEHTNEHTKKIVLFCDNCAGQNKNIKLTLQIKKFLCEQSNIQTIEQRFLLAGHSFNQSCEWLTSR